MWSSGPWLQGAHLDKLLQLKWVQPCVQLTTTVQMVCICIHPLRASATPCHQVAQDDGEYLDGDIPCIKDLLWSNCDCAFDYCRLFAFLPPAHHADLETRSTLSSYSPRLASERRRAICALSRGKANKPIHSTASGMRQGAAQPSASGVICLRKGPV